MNAQGRYFQHRFKNANVIKFGRNKRVIVLDNSETRKITPGPGEYRAPSDFGFIDQPQRKTSIPFTKPQSQRTSPRNVLPSTAKNTTS